MTPRRIATSVMGIGIVILVIVVMAWQIAPVSAGRSVTAGISGFTPIPPTEVPPTEVPPTEVPPTEVPPTDIPATDIPPTAVSTPGTSITATATSITVVGTPEMPVTGGEDTSDQSNTGIALVLLAGLMVLLTIAISLVVRQPARTGNEN